MESASIPTCKTCVTWSSLVQDGAHMCIYSAAFVIFTIMKACVSIIIKFPGQFLVSVGDL